MHPPSVTNFLAVVLAALILGCAPPPEEPDYDDPDAGPHPDAPILLSITPEDGADGVDPLPIFHLTFDRHIDATTLAKHRFNLTSGDKQYGLLSLYDPTQKEVLAWMGGLLLPECTWVFSIRKGLFGLNGAQVPPGVQVTFRTAKDSEFKTPFHVRAFQGEIVPIFEKHCSSCHGGAGPGIANLKLDSKENILETAISVPSTGRPEWQRIAPTRPGESYLLYKLTSDNVITGLRMPRTMDGSSAPPALSKDEKAALFDWITTGAHFVDP